MYLLVFVVFLVLSLILIFLGLYKPEHTEISLVGFVFLFLLSFIIINNQLTTVTGSFTNSTFNYTTSNNMTLLTSSYEHVDNFYTPVVMEGTLAHLVGYWLAVLSIIGFIGVIISIRRTF